MQASTISFIGAGTMATSLIKGLLANDYPVNNIWATNLHIEKLDHLKNLGIHTSTDNRLAVQSSSIIILAVKPQALKNVATHLADLIEEKKHLIISIAAGINLKTLKNYFSDKDNALIRCMPNTPALLGCGATGLFANAYCSLQQKNVAESIFRSVGMALWLDSEEQIDTVTALSGSGPAYFFLLIEALQAVGIELGLSRENAHSLTLQTALGATRMAIESNKPVKQLIENVTSPGGTTERALHILQQGHFSELIEKAVKGAKQRAQILAKQF